MSESITIEFATAGVRAARRAFEKVSDSMEGMQDTARRATRRMGSIFRSVGTAAAVGFGAATTAAGAFAKTVVDAASKMEQARIKFDSIFGSMEKGQKAVQGLRDLASQVPATFGEIVQTGQQIASAVSGPAELQKRMRQLIKLTSVFPINLREAATNWVRFWRAGAGAADLFREKGINAALGVKAGMETTAKESRKLWRDFFRDNQQTLDSALGRLADSWEGTISMLKDQWLDFKLAVGEAGLFDAAKQALEDFRTAFEGFIESGGAERFARVFTRAMATMVGAIQGFVNAVLEAQSFVRDTFVGRVFGFDRTSRGQLAEADKNLQTLQSVMQDLQGGGSVAAAAPRVAAATGEPVRPLPGQDQVTRQQLKIRVFNEIQRLKDQIDGPGGLTDQFSDSSNLVERFNEQMDRLQETLERAARSGGRAADAAGGEGGAIGQQSPLTLEDVSIAEGGRPQLPFFSQIRTGGGPFARLRQAAKRTVTAMDQAGLTLEELPASAKESIREFANVAGISMKEAVERLGGSVDEGGKVMNRTADTVISAFGSMAQAAIRGSDQMVQAVTSSIAQILQSLSRQGGPLSSVPFLGAAVGAAGSIITAIASSGGNNRPQPVEVKNKDPIEVEDQSDRGPSEVQVSVISPLTGERLDEVQYELERRERRDKKQRLPRGATLGGAG